MDWWPRLPDRLQLGLQLQRGTVASAAERAGSMKASVGKAICRHAGVRGISRQTNGKEIEKA